MAGYKKQSSVCISLVNDTCIKKLNKMYRGKNKPTDVLSFNSPKEILALNDFLGDVVISVQTAERNAKEDGITTKEEIARLTIHGLLHLLGYDHEGKKAEAQKMMKLQNKIVAEIL